MTANEIREWNNSLVELQRAGALKPHEVIRALARVEIAAQLAELNEKITPLMDRHLDHLRTNVVLETALNLLRTRGADDTVNQVMDEAERIVTEKGYR
jgi:hypothetical protein